MTVLAGRYRLEERLGRGGMGTVYLATDLSTRQRVAVKRMDHEPTEHSQVRAELRFRREFHTLASLRHPRIVRAHDYGVDGGPFYVMDLLAGRDLRDELRARNAIPAREASLILRDVAAALAVLHARSLVHRDLSPRNVRIIEGRAVLFDFGVLVNAGLSGDVAGTPAFVAPEMLRGEPVDGRADLYSLGVLAYVMLTGHAPYPARELSDLFELWAQPPPPPSTYAIVPEPLEELILDLLCLEPLGRPPSAAAVVDRLTRVALLDADPELVAPLTLLPTTALVGREPELALLDGRLGRLRDGEAAMAYLEGESGAGKSRLLDELALRAKLDGVLVLRVEGEETASSPFAGLAALIGRALRDAPEDTLDAAAPSAAILARVFPELGARFPEVARAEESAEPAEERLRVQRAALDLLRSLAHRRLVAILADDVQRLDEASAAALASLAHAGIPRLLLVAARRLGDDVRAPAALAALASASTPIRLSGLDEAAIERLLRSLFGETPHLDRLAKGLGPASGGSPLLCSELARHLVDVGTIQHDAGTWVIPEDIRVATLPRGLEATLEARLQRLGELAWRVGEALAVHRGDVDLALVPALSEPGEEASTFAGLAELQREGVVIDLGDRYRLRHDAFAAAFLRGMDPERKRTLHRRLGEAMSNLSHDLPHGLAQRDDDVAIGWHLHFGGEEAKGAAVLERAGRRLYEAQALADCIAPLEASLAHLEREGAPLARRAELHFMLLSAGWVSDRPTGARHARPTLEAHRSLSGLALADRLARWTGFFLAFIVAFAVANVRWVFRFGAARGPTPLRALSVFAVGLAYACALAYSANLKGELRALIRYARPFRAFRRQTPEAALLTVEAMSDVIDGHLADATDRLGRALALVKRPTMNPMTAEERQLGDAGVRAIRALVDVNQLDPRLFEDIERLEASGLEYYALAAQTARIVRHRYRGEEALARAIEAECAARSLQLGSWSTDLQILLFAHPAYAFQHDVEGLKRSLAALERHHAAGMDFRTRIAITRGELHRERLEHDLAEAVLAEAMDELSEDDLLMRQYCASARAQNALEDYRWEDARHFARLVVDEGEDPRRRIVLPWLRAQRVLALAESGLDHHDEAIARLDAAIVEAERLDAPLFAGELHEARARAALAAGADRLDFEVHLSRAEDHLRPTGCPGLVAVVERLAELGREDLRRPIDARRRRPDSRSGEHSARSWQRDLLVPTSTDEQLGGAEARTVVSSRPSRGKTAQLASTEVPTTASAPSAKAADARGGEAEQEPRTVIEQS